MINVNDLWLTLQDVTRKDHSGGYMSSEEFNRRLVLAQQLLFDFHFDNQGNELESRMALQPFYKTKRLPSSDSGKTFRLPDHRKHLDIWVGRLTDCDESEYFVSVNLPARNELVLTLGSSVRGPSLARKVVVAEIRSASSLKVWPSIVPPYTLHMNYYINPPAAVRGYTVDPDTDEEVYDPATTTNLEWDEDQYPNILDILLMYQGLALRSSSLLEWIQGKKVLTMQQ